MVHASGKQRLFIQGDKIHLASIISKVKYSCYHYIQPNSLRLLSSGSRCSGTVHVVNMSCSFTLQIASAIGRTFGCSDPSFIAICNRYHFYISWLICNFTRKQNYTSNAWLEIKFKTQSE